MKQNESNHPFSNLLMAWISSEGLENIVSGNSDIEAELIFNKQFQVSLPGDKVKAMLSSLAQSLSKDTLGTLVRKGLEESNSSFTELQTQTGLTHSLLEDIKSDMVFTNSVPVKSLAKLLKLLNVSLEKAQLAIESTFEKLSTESKIFLSIPAKAQPSFRKGASHGNLSFDFKRLKSDESYLYQNKEALNKYTRRLSELYNEL